MHLKLDSKHEAATAYVEAAKCAMKLQVRAMQRGRQRGMPWGQGASRKGQAAVGRLVGAAPGAGCAPSCSSVAAPDTPDSPGSTAASGR